MQEDKDSNSYERLLGRKLSKNEVGKIERNLLGFMKVLIEIDNDQRFNH